MRLAGLLCFLAVIALQATNTDAFGFSPLGLVKAARQPSTWLCTMSSAESSASRLRKLLAQPGILTMPCCFDALSAKLIQRAGFDITFMSGFSTSAAKLALPDTGYISYGEMIDAGRDICSAVSIPVLADGDTG